MSTEELTLEQRAYAEALALPPAAWKARLRQRPVWFMECIDHVLREDLDKRIQLPAFAKTKDIGIFSDYGGEHRESPVLTYSYLIVDFGWLDAFGQAMKNIRAAYKLGSREVSFKELNSTAIGAALPEIMRAADRLPGLLFTLVVHKRYRTILGNDDAPRMARQQVDAAGVTSWKKQSELEGAARKAHTVAYWLSVLAREGMGVFWMTDRDSIAANDTAFVDLQKLLLGSLSTVSAPAFRLYGFAKEFARSEEQPYLNDALAIPDLTAGAFSAVYAERNGSSVHSRKKELPIAEILTPHAHQGVFLKKLTVAFDFDDSGDSTISCLWVDGTSRSQDGYFAIRRPDFTGLDSP